MCLWELIFLLLIKIKIELNILEKHISLDKQYTFNLTLLDD